MLCAKALSAILVPDSTRIRSPMARELWSPIARANSQLFPWVRYEPALSQPLCERVDRSRCKVQPLRAVWILRDDEFVARQGLPAHDLAQVISKVLDRR